MHRRIKITQFSKENSRTTNLKRKSHVFESYFTKGDEDVSEEHLKGKLSTSLPDQLSAPLTNQLSYQLTNQQTNSLNDELSVSRTDQLLQLQAKSFEPTKVNKNVFAKANITLHGLPIKFYIIPITMKKRMSLGGVWTGDQKFREDQIHWT